MRSAPSAKPNRRLQGDVSITVQMEIPSRFDTAQHHQFETLAATARAAHADAPIFAIFPRQR